MNKVIPFVLIVGFWVMYYVGITYPGTGEVMAVVAVICFLSYLLSCLKSYLKKRIMNK